MNMHLQTVGELSLRRDGNEHDIGVLSAKIDRLSKGIRELQTARHVLVSRRRKLLFEMSSLTTRINHEMTEIQGKLDGGEERHEKLREILIEK